MSTKRNQKLYTIIFLLSILNFGNSIIISAQDVSTEDLINPIYGTLVLIGEGDIPENAKATIAYLVNEKDATLTILGSSNETVERTQHLWQNYIKVIKVINLNGKNDIKSIDLNEIKNASALWLADDLSVQFAGSKLNEELKALLRRDGIIGGQGSSAQSMATLVMDKNRVRNGFNLLPNSIVCSTIGGEKNFRKILTQNPGRVGWEMPPLSSVIVHSGRKISVLSYPEITLTTAANGEWPERVASYGPPVDDLPYTTDLISWNRSAVARQGEIFPPANALVPEVPKGALVIIGGHGYPEGMWERVVDFAGGKEANYVCFAQSPSSTGAKMLRALGCKNIAVHVVKTGTDGIGQCDDPQLLEDLKNADAVYFGGGRTYKFMDAYLGSEAHRLMNDVLERGGIILGGSAGAQIQGDFLVRGDPRTNNTIYMEGNDLGLSFIKGVIIDVHFRERGREKTLPSLLVEHPQMLGIGIDETTAIWVQGTVAEVIGPHSVTFYNLDNVKNLDPSSTNIGNPVILMKGEKYDLKQRKPIN